MLPIFRIYRRFTATFDISLVGMMMILAAIFIRRCAMPPPRLAPTRTLEARAAAD